MTGVALRLLVASFVTCVVSQELTRFEPCPTAGAAAPPPIIVTRQHQTVSTCLQPSITTCGFSSGRFANTTAASTAHNITDHCSTKFEYSTYLFVSTQIPCSYSHTAHLSSIITATDQLVTMSHFETTSTFEMPITSTVPTNAVRSFRKRRLSISTSTIHQVWSKDVIVPYKKICDWAMPDFGGSHLDDDCAVVHANGERYQVVLIRKCSGKKPSRCVEYDETWISRPASTTAAAMTAVCSSRRSVRSKGTYYFTFSQGRSVMCHTLPGWTRTLNVGGRTSVLVQPPSTITATHSVEEVIITKTCGGPTVFDFTTTITSTVTVTITLPYQTLTPTSSQTVEISPTSSQNDTPRGSSSSSTSGKFRFDSLIFTFRTSIITSSQITTRIAMSDESKPSTRPSEDTYPTPRTSTSGAMDIDSPVLTATSSISSMTGLTPGVDHGDSSLSSSSLLLSISPLSETLLSTLPISSIESLSSSNTLSLEPVTSITTSSTLLSTGTATKDFTSMLSLSSHFSTSNDDGFINNPSSVSKSGSGSGDETESLTNTATRSILSNFPTSSLPTTLPVASNEPSVDSSTLCIGLLCDNISVSLPVAGGGDISTTLVPGQDTSVSVTVATLTISSPTLSTTILAVPSSLISQVSVPDLSTSCVGFLCDEVSMSVPTASGGDLSVSVLPISDSTSTVLPTLSFILTSITLPVISTTSLDVTTPSLTLTTAAIDVTATNSPTAASLSVPTTSLSILLTTITLSSTPTTPTELIFTTIPSVAFTTDITFLVPTTPSDLLSTTLPSLSLATETSVSTPLTLTGLTSTTFCSESFCIDVSTSSPVVGGDDISITLPPEQESSVASISISTIALAVPATTSLGFSTTLPNISDSVPTIPTVPSTLTSITVPNDSLVSFQTSPTDIFSLSLSSTSCDGLVCFGVSESLSGVSGDIVVTVLPDPETNSGLTTNTAVVSAVTTLQVTIDASSLSLTVPSITSSPDVTVDASSVLASASTTLLDISTSCNAIICKEASGNLPIVSGDVDFTVLPGQDASSEIDTTSLLASTPTSITLNTTPLTAALTPTLISVSTSCDGLFCVEVSASIPGVSENVGATLLPGQGSSSVLTSLTAISTPDTDAIATPDVTTPDVTTPDVTTPDITIVPTVTTPDTTIITTPNIATLDVPSPVITTFLSTPDITSTIVTTPDLTGILTTTTLDTNIATTLDFTISDTMISDVTTPDVSSPDISTSSITTPDLTTLAINPAISTLDVTTTSITIPDITISVNTTPDVTSLVITTSDIATAAVTNLDITTTITSLPSSFGTSTSCSGLVCVEVSTSAPVVATIDVGATVLPDQDSSSTQVTFISLPPTTTPTIASNPTTLATTTNLASSLLTSTSCNSAVCVEDLTSVPVGGDVDASVTILSGQDTSLSSISDTGIANSHMIATPTTILSITSAAPIISTTCSGLVCLEVSASLSTAGDEVDATVLPSQGSSTSKTISTDSRTLVIPLATPSITITTDGLQTLSTSCNSPLCIEVTVSLSGVSGEVGATLLPDQQSTSATSTLTSVIKDIVSSTGLASLTTTVSSLIITASSCNGLACFDGSTSSAGVGGDVAVTVLPDQNTVDTTTSAIVATPSISIDSVRSLTSSTTCQGLLCVDASVSVSTVVSPGVEATILPVQSSSSLTTLVTLSSVPSTTTDVTNLSPTSCNGPVCVKLPTGLGSNDTGAGATISTSQSSPTIVGSSITTLTSIATVISTTPTTLTTLTTTSTSIALGLGTTSACRGLLCVSVSTDLAGNGADAAATVLPSSSLSTVSTVTLTISTTVQTTTAPATTVPTTTVQTTTGLTISTTTTSSTTSGSTVTTSSSSVACSGALCVSASANLGGPSVNIGATVLPSSSSSLITTTTSTKATTTATMTMTTTTTTTNTTNAIVTTTTTTTTTMMAPTTTSPTTTTITTITTSKPAVSATTTLTTTIATSSSNVTVSCNGLVCVNVSVTAAGVTVGASATVLGTSGTANASAGVNTTPTTFRTSTTTTSKPIVAIPPLA